MNAKVRIGILGCANIAERYTLKAFQAIPNSEVVSIASRDARKAEEWASKFGIPKSESYDSLVQNDEVDAIYIPLPIGLHKEWLLRAAKNGKHLLCEKSLAPSLEDVKEIIKTCKENNVVLYENFTCDYHPQHHRVTDLIKEGEIGQPYIFDSIYGFPLLGADNFRYKKELSGSALSESGAYQVYTARKLFGKDPVSVSANLYIDPSTEVDMNGSVFNLDAVYQNNYSVWGSTGLVKVGRAFAIAPTMKPIVELVKNENRQETITPLDIPAHNHFETIFSEFCDLVLNKETKKEMIENKYSDLLIQARVLEAIRVSSKENRKVQLEEIN
jgi:predicted dehydrogenase